MEIYLLPKSICLLLQHIIRYVLIGLISYIFPLKLASDTELHDPFIQFFCSYLNTYSLMENIWIAFIFW